jgi:hypothetical protein
MEVIKSIYRSVQEYLTKLPYQGYLYKGMLWNQSNFFLLLFLLDSFWNSNPTPVHP